MSELKIYVLFLLITAACYTQTLIVTVIDKDLIFLLRVLRFIIRLICRLNILRFWGLAEIFRYCSGSYFCCYAHYAEERVRVLQNSRRLRFTCPFEVIEGKELVVERKALGRTDEKAEFDCCR